MYNIYYQNVNRIRSKTTDVYLNILNSNFDIICLTETNLNSSVFDGEVLDNRYNVFRRDRYTSSSSKSDGGGVLIAVQKHLNVLQHHSMSSDVEDIWISILPNSPSSPKINLCVCYLPPDLPNDKSTSFYNKLQNNLLENHTSDINLIIGDFNIPTLSWHSMSNDPNILKPSSPSDFRSTLLVSTLALCNLSQFNNVPNKNGRWLDLVLSNKQSIAVTETDPISRVDRHHPPLLIELDNSSLSSKGIKTKKRLRLNFEKADYVKIRHELTAVDWSVVLSDDDIDLAVESFYEELHNIIIKHVPLSKDDSHIYPVWFSPPLKHCLNEKLKYHKRFKKFGNPRDYDTYAMLRTRSKTLMKSCYKSFISSTEASLEGNTKSFWRFINNRKGKKTIPSSMSLGGKTASDSQGITELLSEYFASVFEKPSSPTQQFQLDNMVNDSLSKIILSEDEVIRKIKSLDTNKGAGPDKIPAKFIKNCCDQLSYPLTLLFNRSLETGVFPSCWKLAHVVPIHKAGDNTNCENYRPISILSCIAKLFESLVYNFFFSHIKPLLSEHQHGFVKGKSISSNLLEYKNYLCTAFSRRGQVDSIYTDFKKAFDKVNHSLLCTKLSCYGVHGSLLRWVESYLHKRSQLVAIGGYQSSPVLIDSGVPQGSHLGPLFFIVFINDLIHRLSCRCLLYADDLKVFHSIETDNDCALLQRDADAISEWCHANNMYLNVSKCFIITFTNKKAYIKNKYKLEGQVLERKTVAKDLGILFDQKLTFRDHYDHIINKAYGMLGFVVRSTKGFKNPNSFIYLYNALIRSVLEYGSIIWSPHYAVHSERIEGVQKKMLRILSFKSGYGRSLISYTQRLGQFNVTPLYVRRMHQDLLYLHKIIHSVIDSPTLLSLINFNTKPNPRHPKPFHLQSYKNNISFFNPIARMCRLYNDYASTKDSVVDVFDPKVIRFKRQVRMLKFDTE